MKLTRRKLLGGIGLGTFGVSGGTFDRSRRDYSHYTYAAHGDTDDHRLAIAWYERYNGRFQERQNGASDPGLADTLDPDSRPAYSTEATFVSDETGPGISLGNVLPGDEGTLVIGLEAVDGVAITEEPLDVWLQAGITADDENGVNGPELAAGDVTSTNGELDDELTVEIWRDGSPLGTCNGQKEFDETLEQPIISRTPMSVAFNSSSSIGSENGRRIVDGLDPGEAQCIALAWAFPKATATNRSQGDSVRFDLRFGGVGRGTPSPFGSTAGANP